MKKNKFNKDNAFALYERQKSSVNGNRINVIIPRRLHDAINEISYRENISMTKFTRDALIHHLTEVKGDSMTKDMRKGGNIIHTTMIMTAEIKSSIRETSHYKRLPKKELIQTCLYLEVMSFGDKYNDVVLALDAE